MVEWPDLDGGWRGSEFRGLHIRPRYHGDATWRFKRVGDCRSKLPILGRKFESFGENRLSALRYGLHHDRVACSQRTRSAVVGRTGAKTAGSR